MVSYNDHRATDRQFIFVDELHRIAQYIEGAEQAKVKHINRPFMRRVAKKPVADPLYGLKYDQH
ncbi:hypothetical protein GCM10023149_41490 [Mucilaginibacter gynuensis]|uniref:Uncharacterized protein n=1 Tax=Mucilaginibacter gynuensis TaxID=1302236 RepID=A0ABP8H4H6_9SPHI